MRVILCAAAALLAGCNLYFDGGDQDCPVYVEVAPNQVRNPETGGCEDWGWGGGCDDGCNPCLAETAPFPDWGSCFGACAALDESDCVTAASCRAAFTNPFNDGPRLFEGCWSVAPSGPIRGECSGLDAYQCSRHDDCSAVYNIGIIDDGELSFEACIAERPSCYSDDDCGAGTHCSDGDCG